MDFKHILREWIIPPGLLKIKKSLINYSQVNSSKSVEAIRESYLLPGQEKLLCNFKDKYKGQSCFILATGPSIREQDLKKLKGENCIAVSQFHLHRDIDVIKPIWHVMAPSHPPFKFDTLETIFSTAFESYKNFEDINFLLGTNEYAYSYFEYLKDQNNDFSKRFLDNIHFVNYTGSQMLEEDNFSEKELWDIEEKPFAIRTVIYTAIQLAYFLGFSRIYLIGSDHDYLSDISRVENHHFYEESKSFSDKEHLKLFTRERWFYEYYMRWKDYRLIKSFLTDKNVTIYNATKGGMLDVFPRVNLEDVI